MRAKACRRSTSGIVPQRAHGLQWIQPVAPVRLNASLHHLPLWALLLCNTGGRRAVDFGHLRYCAAAPHLSAISSSWEGGMAPFGPGEIKLFLPLNKGDGSAMMHNKCDLYMFNIPPDMQAFNQFLSV